MTLDGAPKEVWGEFICSYNKLITLIGAPKLVWGFDCSYNNLTSIGGSPRKVEGDYNCSHNKLNSLNGLPKIIGHSDGGGNFDCSYNSLKSLDGSPKVIDGAFNCSHNKLKTLSGGPVSVEFEYNCSHNHLATLEGVPKKANKINCSNNKISTLVGSPSGCDLDCSYNNLISLEGISDEIGHFNCSDNKLTSLIGAPTIIHGDFNCSGNNLSSLDGCSKIIDGDFICGDNAVEFTDEYVRSKCSVKGKVKAFSLKNVALTDLEVGSRFGGGIIAYIFKPFDAAYKSGETHGIIAAEKDIARDNIKLFRWSNVYSSISRNNEIGDGQSSTDSIINRINHVASAALLCREYSVIVDGVTYSDWYLPNQKELDELYKSAFIIGGFDRNCYWSSSLSQHYNPRFQVCAQNFKNGSHVSFKTNELNLVRAVRLF